MNLFRRKVSLPLKSFKNLPHATCNTYMRCDYLEMEHRVGAGAFVAPVLVVRGQVELEGAGPGCGFRRGPFPAPGV